MSKQNADVVDRRRDREGEIMRHDGKNLESLVSEVERLLLPKGFAVAANSKVIDDSGRPVAEFDIEITGKLGAGDLRWLIECRDRPSEGPAPASWIEQLVGRRDRFNFNKVTAVSTTGFSPAAEEYARTKGIEIRSVSEILPTELEGWLSRTNVISVVQHHDLKGVKIIVAENRNEVLAYEFRQLLSALLPTTPIFRSTSHNTTVSTVQAFSAAVKDAPALFEGLVPNGPEREVLLEVEYPNDESHYVVDLKSGRVRIQRLDFRGIFWVTEQVAPLASAREYGFIEPTKAIAQMAMFGPIEVGDSKFSFEIRDVSGTDEMQLVVTKI